MTMLKIGEACKANGDPGQALPCFVDALKIERGSALQGNPATVARALNEAGGTHLARGDVAPMMEACDKAARAFPDPGSSATSLSMPGQLHAFEILCPEAAPAA